MELKTTVFYKGGETTYTFPFEYLQKNFVKVRYQKPDASYVNLEYTKDYTVTEDRITLMTAGSADDIINIYRSTPTDRLVKYVDASILKAHDMNVDELQTLHIMEEQTDYLTSYALFKADNANRWDAQQLRLTNVALPQEPTDAVNKAYVDEFGVTWNQNVAQMKKQLEEQDAKIKKQIDDKDAEWSKQLKEQSDGFDALIKKHDDTFTADMSAQVELAKKWAVSEESPDGTEGAKSAKTWAGEAQTSGQSALDSATKAVASATEAKESATQAEASKGAAKTSEVNAKASADAAAQSAQEASAGQINSDWNETDNTSRAYIRNKPDVALKSDLDTVSQSITENILPRVDALSDSITTKNLTVSGETSVPTANEGNSSNAIASTEFVAKSLAKMVDSAPETLNTLNELAKALGNDPNFATTVMELLAKKLNSAEAESTYIPKSDIPIENWERKAEAYSAQTKRPTFRLCSSATTKTPNNGIVLTYGLEDNKYCGQLFLPDNGKDGVWYGGYSGSDTHLGWYRLAHYTTDGHLKFPTDAEMWVS